MTSRIFKKHGICFENYAMQTPLDPEGLYFDENASDEDRIRDFDDVVDGLGVAFETIDYLCETQYLLRQAGPNNKTAAKLTHMAIETAQRRLRFKFTKKTPSIGTESLADGGYSVAMESIGEIINAIIDAIKETFISLWEWIKSFFDSEGREKAKEKADTSAAEAEASLTGEAPRTGKSKKRIIEHKIVAFDKLPEDKKKQAIATLSAHLEHFKFLLPNPTVEDLTTHIEECVKLTQAFSETASSYDGIESRLIRLSEEGIRDITQNKLDANSFKQGTEENNKDIDATLAKVGRAIGSKKVKEALASRGASKAEGAADFVANAKVVFTGSDSQQLVMYCPPNRIESHPKFLRIEAFTSEETAVTEQSCISLESSKEDILKYIGVVFEFRMESDKLERKLKDAQKKSKAIRDKVLKGFQTLEANAKSGGENAERDALIKELLSHMRHQCAIFGKTSADLVKAANVISMTCTHHANMSAAVTSAFGMPALDASVKPGTTNAPQPPAPEPAPGAPAPAAGAPAPSDPSPSPPAPSPSPAPKPAEDDDDVYII